MTKRTRKQLLDSLRSARDELDDLDRKETAKTYVALVGRCYKFRNCFSCPKDDGDYWYIYKQCLRIEDEKPIFLCFENDKNGKISIYFDSRHAEYSGWAEVDLKDFWAEWLKMKANISKHQGMILSQ